MLYITKSFYKFPLTLPFCFLVSDGDVLMMDSGFCWKYHLTKALLVIFFVTKLLVQTNILKLTYTSKFVQQMAYAV